MKKSFLYLILSLSFCIDAFAQNNSVDLRSKELGPALDQGSTNLCYAYSSAVLLSYFYKKQISPLAIAFDFEIMNSYKSNKNVNAALVGLYKNSGNPYNLLNSLQSQDLCLESEFPSERRQGSINRFIKKFRFLTPSLNSKAVVILKVVQKELVKNYLSELLDRNGDVKPTTELESTLNRNLRLDCAILDEDEPLDAGPISCVKDQAQLGLNFLSKVSDQDSLLLNFEYIQTRSYDQPEIPAGLFSKDQLLQEKVDPKTGIVFRYNLNMEENYLDTTGWIFEENEASLKLFESRSTDLKLLAFDKKTLCTPKPWYNKKFIVQQSKDAHLVVDQVNALLDQGIPVLLADARHAKVILGKRYVEDRVEWLVRDSSPTALGDHYLSPQSQTISFGSIVWLEAEQ